MESWVSLSPDPDEEPTEKVLYPTYEKWGFKLGVPFPTLQAEEGT